MDDIRNIKMLEVISNFMAKDGSKIVKYAWLDKEEVWHTFEVIKSKLWVNLTYPGALVEAAKKEKQQVENAKRITEVPKDFINGFKVIRFGNGEYGYMKEDGTVDHHRFDIAGNFNEYGFAMVAKNGKVTWINREFCFLSTRLDEDTGLYVHEMTAKEMIPSQSYNSIEDFMGEESPISSIQYYHDCCMTYFFLNTSGEIQKFFSYRNPKEPKCSLRDYRTMFSKKPTFDKHGVALVDNIVLFANGRYISVSFLIDILKNLGLLDQIDELVNNYPLESKPIDTKDSYKIKPKKDYGTQQNN